MTKPKGEKPRERAAKGDTMIDPWGAAEGPWAESEKVEACETVDLDGLCARERLAGAQSERDDYRKRLKRRIAYFRRGNLPGDAFVASVLGEELRWLDKRPARYNAAPGGIQSSLRGPGKVARRA